MLTNKYSVSIFHPVFWWGHLHSKSSSNIGNWPLGHQWRVGSSSCCCHLFTNFNLFFVFCFCKSPKCFRFDNKYSCIHGCLVLFCSFLPNRSKTAAWSWLVSTPSLMSREFETWLENTEPLTDVAPYWTALVTKWIPGPWPILLHIATTLLHKVDKFSV